MNQEDKSNWGRRLALGAIYTYFILLIGTFVLMAFDIKALDFIYVEIPLFIGGISGLSGWIYCMVHAGRRKDLIHPQKLYLLIAIIFLNCTACLFYLHSKILFFPRSEPDDGKSVPLIKKRIAQLYLFTITILVAIFIIGSFASRMSDLRNEERRFAASNELLEKSEQSLKTSDFLEAYKLLDRHHWSAVRLTGARLTLDSQLRRVILLGIDQYLQSGDLENATALLGGACKHGFMTSSAPESLKRALQQVIEQYQDQMKRHLEQNQFQEALNTYESSIVLEPCMKTEFKGGFLQLKLLKEQAEQMQKASLTGSSAH